MWEFEKQHKKEKKKSEKMSPVVPATKWIQRIPTKQQSQKKFCDIPFTSDNMWKYEMLLYNRHIKTGRWFECNELLVLAGWIIINNIKINSPVERLRTSEPKTVIQYGRAWEAYVPAYHN